MTILVALLGLAAFIAALVYANHRDQLVAEARRKQILDYDIQLTELTKVETSLRNLTEFVRSQKTRLSESEDLIASLKSEQQRLTPVVEADRRVVKAVLDVQAQQLHAGMVRDRWIGFGLGIIASFVASVVYGVLRPLLRKHGS